nr:hypothetical protein [Tanacetum cinerariifolium]
MKQGCLRQQNLDLTKLIFSWSLDDNYKVEKELEPLDDLINRNSTLNKNAKWKILFSDDFRRSFGKLTSEPVKKSVLNLLLRLSNGWCPERSLGLPHENSAQSLKQFNVEGLYIISTIDIIKDINYVQVIKKIILVVALKNYSKGDKEVSLDSGGGSNYVENSKGSESLLLMKFYLFSNEVVCHLLSEDEVDLPMQLTDEQMDILLFRKNAEVVNDPVHSNPSVLRQLFVTFSPRLCYAVKQHLSDLTSISSNGNSLAEIGLDADNVTSEFSDIPDTFINIPRNIYPLVITFH